jgi:phosphatidylinositol 4-kinase B
MNIVFPIFLGVCFPLGKGIYRVLNIPEEEAVLLNSREKTPYLICVEVLRYEMPRYRIIIIMSCGK